MDDNLIFNKNKFHEAFMDSFKNQPIHSIEYNKETISYIVLDEGKHEFKTSHIFKFKEKKLPIHNLIYKDLITYRLNQIK